MLFKTLQVCAIDQYVHVLRRSLDAVHVESECSGDGVVDLIGSQSLSEYARRLVYLRSSHEEFVYALECCIHGSVDCTHALKIALSGGQSEPKGVTAANSSTCDRPCHKGLASAVNSARDRARAAGPPAGSRAPRTSSGTG